MAEIARPIPTCPFCGQLDMEYILYLDERAGEGSCPVCGQTFRFKIVEVYTTWSPDEVEP